MFTKVIAEIGLNMNGSMEHAREMILQAKLCKVNSVKSQKRTIKEYLSEKQYNMPYENPNSFGKTYGEHREFLELSQQQHQELMNYAAGVGITYFVSVWDVSAARQMQEINMPIFKIPSACLTNNALLEEVRSYDKPIYLSTGMSTIEEIDRAVEILKNTDLTLFHCTSCYPCHFEDVRLKVIPFLKERYKVPIGYSGHHLGIAIDLGAVMLGATTIERHVTLDRTMKGTDHAASLEFQGLQKLVRDIQALEKCLLHDTKELLECEKYSWKKLRTVNP
jgi:N-acetylneuraminate synthase